LSTIGPIGAISASLLTSVRRFIGTPDKLCRVIFCRDLGDAKPSRHVQHLSRKTHDPTFDHFAKASGGNSRFAKVGGGQQDRELFAAVWTRQIHLPSRFREQLANVSQDFIPSHETTHRSRWRKIDSTAKAFATSDFLPTSFGFSVPPLGAWHYPKLPDALLGLRQAPKSNPILPPACSA
jgi:hypothetical protein